MNKPSYSYYEWEVMQLARAAIEQLPPDLRGRIGYGYYGEILQFYIIGVDATLAQLGDFPLPSPERLRKIVTDADAYALADTHT